jgi:hypothetical protein
MQEIQKQENIRVITYGSCRVFEPILLLKGLGCIKATELLGKWYTHTTKETIQKSLILDCLKPVPLHIMPLIMADHTKCKAVHDDIESKFQKSAKGRYNNPGDVILIEISSIKEVIIGDYIGQIGAINDIKHNKSNLSKESFAVLSQASQVTQTADELYNDLTELHKMFGNKKMILVSHFNIDAQDGSGKIASRQMISEVLQKFSTENNIDYFDPTPIIKKAGQSNALHNSTHYKDSFFPEIAEELSKLIFGKAPEIISKLALHYRLKRDAAYDAAIEVATALIAELKPEYRKQLLLSMAEIFEAQKDFKSAADSYKKIIYKKY